MISLDIITAAIHKSMPFPIRNTNAVPTSSLSAIGSINLPKSVTCFLFRAMYLDEEIDFSASTKRLPDRSMIVTVVHPSGTFQFNVPAEERAAVAARMRQEGGGQEGF